MADLFRILSTGASSLAAQTAAAATAAHNLQNVNTPGYARQRVTIEATLPAELVGNAYLGRGATLGQVTQARDRFLEAQLPAAFGNSAGSTAASDVLGAVEALDPQATGGLGDAISGFYTALSQLSQNPSDPSLRQAAVGAARSLALSFQATRRGLEDARTGVDQRLVGDVSETNDLASQVASLNGQIRAARAGGAGEPNDLLDARQKAVDRLAELTGATPVPTSEGDVSLFLAGGTPLVTSMKASVLSAQADPANGGHQSVRIETGGVTQGVTPGGELGGLLSARDGALRSAVSGLDGFAWDLAGAVNAVHQAGVDLDGNPGQALFQVSSAAGAAGQLAVNAAVVADSDLLATRQPGGGTGDSSNALALLATQSAALSGGLDSSATLSQVTSAFGAAARTASASADADAALKGHLVTMRESTSGVSTDDELVEMQKAQRAYEGIARVITVTSSMFDTLLAIK